MRVGGAMLPFAKENMKALTYDIFIEYPISSLRGSLWYDHAISLNVQSLKPIILAQHQSFHQNFAPNCSLCLVMPKTQSLCPLPTEKLAKAPPTLTPSPVHMQRKSTNGFIT